MDGETMNRLRLLQDGTGIGLIALTLICGCGKSDSTTETTNGGGAQTGSAESAGPLTASIGGPTDGPAGEETGAPKEGTPEWCLLEIHNVRSAPISTEQSAADVAKLRAERNAQIIKLATEAI